MEAKKLHERIIGLRTYVAIGLVVAATTHHLGMGAVPIEYHLTTEIFVYGICAPAAAWLLLGWLARSAAATDAANQEQAETAARLARRNRQIEAIHTANRFLVGARDVQSVAGPLVELAGQIADAHQAALLIFPERRGDPNIATWSQQGFPADDLGLAELVRADAAPCLSCPQSHRCGSSGDIRCLPLMNGQEIVGLMRVADPIWSADTRSSLEIFIGEITTAWESHRAEDRALIAFQKIGTGYFNQANLELTLCNILELLLDALDAEAGAFFKLENGQFMSEETFGGGNISPPRALPESTNTAIWSENNGRDLYVLAEGARVIALSFSAPRVLTNQDKRLVEVIAALTGFVALAADTFGDLIWDERRRISNELHDGIAQTVAYLNLKMHRAIDAWRVENYEEAGTGFQEISLSLLDAYEEIRMAVDDLRLYPGRRERAGQFLRRMAASFAAREGISINLKLPPDFELPPEILAQVTRVFQEALHNAVVHGEASHIDLVIERGLDDLALSISDNGSGFDPEVIPVRSHYGLAVMRERVEELGGNFTLDSQTGRGTRIFAKIPLPKAPFQLT